MSSLSQDVAALEKARADGKLKGRDLDVVETQVARAEKKILNKLRACAWSGQTRRTFEPDADAA